MAISRQPMRTNFGSGIASAETSTVFPLISACAGTKDTPSLESSNQDGACPSVVVKPFTMPLKETTTFDPSREADWKRGADATTPSFLYWFLRAAAARRSPTGRLWIGWTFLISMFVSWMGITATPGIVSAALYCAAQIVSARRLALVGGLPLEVAENT